MSSKAKKKKHNAYSTGLFAGMPVLAERAADSNRNELSKKFIQVSKEFDTMMNEVNGKSKTKKYMTFWLDFEGQNLFDQYIDMSYLSDDFEDANFFLVDAGSKYEAARQFVTGKYNDLIRRNKRSEIQNMCLEYIFEELSEGEHVQVEGKIGHLISAIENLMEAYEIDDASSEEMDPFKMFFSKSNVSELFTPEVELELFIKENIHNVGVLELKTFLQT
ncbi:MULTISPECIES: hypothetical protein [unclassified Butyrivibrio]|uniref:hypothetical protein n=1 Tax=unclassified Butyrivibrio TaxID=2639466 RepID=UPI00041F3DC9|nr:MULTISPECIES: hypothetical protein [unclassified Butyrivibrio]